MSSLCEFVISGDYESGHSAGCALQDIAKESIRSRIYPAESVHQVVLQKSILAKILQLILDIINDRG